jgi:O-glycosyl hydrolase
MEKSEGIKLSSTRVSSYESLPSDDQGSSKIPASCRTKSGQRLITIVALLAVFAALTGTFVQILLRKECRTVHVFRTTSDGSSQLSAHAGSARVECIEDRDPRETSSADGLATASVEVHLKSPKQGIIGFGGAFTEAAAITFASLPAFAQQKVLDLYWGKEGIGYSVGRIPINSCDFSVASYSFDEHAGDWDLDFFDKNVSHDQEFLVPFLKRALTTAKASDLSPMKLFGSPWSPPAWLKAPVNQQHSMTGSHEPAGLSSDGRSKRTWAKYLSTWVTAYSNQGIPLWGLTVQNEPEVRQKPLC